MSSGLSCNSFPWKIWLSIIDEIKLIDDVKDKVMDEVKKLYEELNNEN